MNQDLTDIICIIDRSGSMITTREDAEGGFKAFIEDQKKVPGDCRVTLVQFDDQYDTVYTRLPLKDIPPYSLEPRGNTALRDAVGKTIDTMGKTFASLPGSERPTNVVVLIVTDGYENASHLYSVEKLKSMITHQRDKYGWTFLYVGATEDALSTAASYGIPVSTSIQYVANSLGTQNTYNVVSNATQVVRGGGSAKFTDDDRVKALATP